MKTDEQARKVKEIIDSWPKIGEVTWENSLLCEMALFIVNCFVEAETTLKEKESFIFDNKRHNARLVIKDDSLIWTIGERSYRDGTKFETFRISFPTQQIFIDRLKLTENEEDPLETELVSTDELLIGEEIKPRKEFEKVILLARDIVNIFFPPE